MNHSAASVERTRRINFAAAGIIGREADGVEYLNVLAKMVWEGLVEGMASDWLSDQVRRTAVSALLKLHAEVEACRSGYYAGGGTDVGGGWKPLLDRTLLDLVGWLAMSQARRKLWKRSRWTVWWKK